MDIRRSGSQPSAKGPKDDCTGGVGIDIPFAGSGGLSAATLTFASGRPAMPILRKAFEEQSL